ncbi:MAG TPA: hypothetical protein VD993_18520 [Chitinophagaceae bacterium]|nr:hypothetical protein [Chitinophagaceae bacterium]
MKGNLQKTWERFALNVGGAFECSTGGSEFHKYEKYVIKFIYNGNKIVITIYFQSIPERGKSPFLVRYTRMDISFINKANVHFVVRKKGWVTSMIAIFTGTRVQSGYADFDKMFVVHGRPMARVVEIFSQETVRVSMIRLGDLHVSIINNKEFHDYFLDPGNDVIQINVNQILRSEEDIQRFFSLGILILANTAAQNVRTFQK